MKPLPNCNLIFDDALALLLHNVAFSAQKLILLNRFDAPDSDAAREFREHK